MYVGIDVYVYVCILIGFFLFLHEGAGGKLKSLDRLESHNGKGTQDLEVRSCGL